MGKPANKSSGGGLLLLLLLVLAVVAFKRNGTAPLGDNAAGAEYVKPAEGQLTSGYGPRWGTTHGGIDIANKIGTPIRAVAAGTVIEAGPATGFGLWMQIRHHDGTVTVYGHMNTINKPEGARVSAGDLIATIGQRGQSTGPHLHFEVWPHGNRAARIDPAPWLKARGITFA